MSAPDLRAEAAAALLAINRRRRRIRRWVAIGTLPLTLAALLFVGKVLSMYAFAHQSITSYVMGDYAGATTSAEALKPLNLFERYAAPYDTGTALAGADELDRARTELENAAAVAEGQQVCAVRINLAIVIERQGDAALADGDGASAAQLYGEALLVTTETPDECSSDEAQEQSPDPDRDMSDTIDGLEDRLKQKQEQSAQEPADPQQSDGEQEQLQTTPQDKLDELEEKLRQGAEEREQNQSGGEEPGGGTDKPW